MVDLLDVTLAFAYIPTLFFGRYLAQETDLWNAIITSLIWFPLIYLGFFRITYVLISLPFVDALGLLYLLSYPAAGFVWLIFGAVIGKKWTPILMGAFGTHLGLIFWIMFPLWLCMMGGAIIGLFIYKEQLP